MLHASSVLYIPPGDLLSKPALILCIHYLFTNLLILYVLSTIYTPLGDLFLMLLLMLYIPLYLDDLFRLHFESKTHKPLSYLLRTHTLMLCVPFNINDFLLRYAVKIVRRHLNFSLKQLSPLAFFLPYLFFLYMLLSLANVDKSQDHHCGKLFIVVYSRLYLPYLLPHHYLLTAYKFAHDLSLMQ